jgi:hypothetical protein
MNYFKLNVILIVVLVSLELYSNQEVTTTVQPDTSSPTDSTTMAPSDQTTTSTVQNRNLIIQGIIDLVKDNPNFWYMNEGLFVLREIPSDDYDEDW